MVAIGVMMVDPSRAFLDAAESYLMLQQNTRVIAKLQDETEALDQAERLKPDLVFVEPFALRRGLALAKELRHLKNAPRVIVLTDHEEEPYRELALNLPVDDFVLKRSFCSELPRLLDACMSQAH